MSLAILKISDGTNEINLLEANTTINGVGVGLAGDGWFPSIPAVIPTFQSSPLSSGRRLSSYKFDNATETFQTKVSREDQNSLIETIQDYRRLLIQGIDYHVVDWQNSLVYLIARASCETNTRYALLINYQFPSDDFPYGGTFVGKNKATEDDLVVIIERGDWLELPPGQGSAITSGETRNQESQEWIQRGNIAAHALMRSRMLEQTDTGDIYVPHDEDVYKSTDNGLNWAISYTGFAGTPPNFDLAKGLAQTPNGDLYVGQIDASDDGTIYRSVNDGAAWVGVDTITGPDNTPALVGLSNGNIIGFYGKDAASAGNALIRKSTDGGTSWTTKLTITSGVFSQQGMQLENGWILFVGSAPGDAIYRSKDNGETWEVITDSNFFNLTFMDQNSITERILLGSATGVLASDDNGDTWSILSQLPAFTPHDFSYTSDGIVYATNGASNGTVYISQDDGLTWATQAFTPSSPAWSILALNDGSVVAAVGVIASIDFSIELVTSISATIGLSGELSYLVNKSNDADITHIKISDGGVFSDIYPMASLPTSLLPTSPAVNDAVYFGISEEFIVNGPFNNLIFDLVGINKTGTYTIVWEYWNAAWVTLTTRDNTKVISTFDRDGISSVHWVQPSDWTTTTIDSVNAYWIRARVSAITTGVITPPIQQNQSIFTTITPFVSIDNQDVGGDLPALARYKLFNESDEDGDGGSSPDLWSNRIFAGLRSTSRGVEFRSFINFADEQNVPGITVTAGTNTAFSNDVTTPTSRRLTYSAVAGDTSFVDRAIVTISPSIIRNYYGTFHAFMRGNVGSGSAGDIVCRLQIKTSSGGVVFTSDSVSFQTTSDWELLDLSSIIIPAGGRSIIATELGDEGTIALQIKNTSGASRTVKLYDFIIIPTDEWAGDFQDKVDTSDSIIGRQNDVQHLLDIDSIVNPKVNGRSIVRLNDSNLTISAIYEFATNGGVILQANADQKLHVLSARLGASSEWISEPSIAWSVKVYRNQRYLSFRGAR